MTHFSSCRHCGAPFGVETTASRMGVCGSCLSERLTRAFRVLEDAQDKANWRRTSYWRRKVAEAGAEVRYWQGEWHRYTRHDGWPCNCQPAKYATEEVR